MVVSIHLATLILTVVCILYADHMGFEYIQGKRTHMVYAQMRRLHRMVWAGLLGMILSGAALAIPMSEYLVTEPVFMLKMGFVAVLFINALVIGTFIPLVCTRSFKDLTTSEKVSLGISGAVSIVCWVGAAAVGFLFF